jgi:hypothetical protein
MACNDLLQPVALIWDSLMHSPPQLRLDFLQLRLHAGARGDVIVVRYADDLVAGFEYEDDASRFLDAMRERFAAFSLSLHPVKTRVIEFGRRAAVNRKKRGVSRPDTFAFLGFTFICSKSRRRSFQLQRKTRRDSPSPAFGPQIEDVVQIDVAEEW